MLERGDEAEVDYAIAHSMLAPGHRGVPAPCYVLLALPIGLGRGFITIALAWLLTRNGVGIGAIATLAALYTLPEVWKFLIGPVIDASLTPKAWFLLMVVVGMLLLLGLGLVPLTGEWLLPIQAMTLLLAAAFTMAHGAMIVAMVHTTPVHERGRVAGWMQAGNLGGTGVGGGLGLWLATHGGGQLGAAFGLAAVLLLAMAPMIWMRTQPLHEGGSPLARVAALWRPMLALLLTREGVITAVAVTLPMGLGAGLGLLAAVAHEWHASADLVALVLGAIGALANLPGCVAAGYLADRFPRRLVFVVACLFCAAAEIAMALGPRTPFAFGAFVLLNAVFLGAAWAAVGAVIFEQLGAKAAATLSTILGGLSNIPLAMASAWLGQVGERGGGKAILLAEGWLGLASIGAFAVLLWLWRPRPVMAANPA
jgi:MFS family permease